MPKDLPRPFPAPLRAAALPDTAPRGAPAPPVYPSPPGEGAAGRSWAAAGSTRPLGVLCEGARSQPSQEAREALGGSPVLHAPAVASAHPHPGLTALPTLSPRGGSAASQQLLATAPARHWQLCSCSRAHPPREAVGHKAAPHAGCRWDTGQGDGAHRGAPPGWGIPEPARPLAAPAGALCQGRKVTALRCPRSGFWDRYGSGDSSGDGAAHAVSLGHGEAAARLATAPAPTPQPGHWGAPDQPKPRAPSP